MKRPDCRAIAAIATSFLMMTVLGELGSQPAHSQEISGCTATLRATLTEPELRIRDGVGVEFYTHNYGIPGEKVSVLQGNRDGLAIAKDQYGNDWVKIESITTGARGWIRRDTLSLFQCDQATGFPGAMPHLAQGEPYAVKLREGITAFAGYPRLVSVTTTENLTRAWNAVYYFTIHLPPDASESLRVVEITQTPGMDVSRYDEQETEIFAGNRRDRGASFAIQEILIQPQTITIILQEPIPPGTTFTVALSPVKTPQFTGVYLFGVAVFPDGEKPQRAFLGFGRLHFYHPYF